MDKWLIVITAGFQQLKSIIQCKNLGLKIFSIDENPDAAGFKFSDIHYVQNISNTKDIIEEIKRNKIKPIGVASFVSDVGILCAAKIRSYFNIDGVSVNRANIHINKQKQKYLCKKNNISIPPYVIIDNLENIEKKINCLAYPLIIKPVIGSGSRGVSKIADLEQFFKTINEIKSLTIGQKIIVEEFIEGEEFSIETFSNKGHLSILAISKRRVNKFMTAEEIYSYDLDSNLIDDIYKQIKEIYNFSGNPDGPGHFEIIINKFNHPIVIDIAFRGGGFEIFNFLIKKVSGYDIIKNTINQFTFQPVEQLERIARVHNFVLIHFLLSKKGKLDKIYGFQEANKIQNVIAYNFFSQESLNYNTIKNRKENIIPFKRNIPLKEKGLLLGKNKSDSDRLGMIICVGKNIKECKKLRNLALEKIFIKIIN